MMNQATLTDRMMRAARIDVNLFEEVERDESATSQALTVVIIVAVAGAIGAALGVLLFGGAAPAGTPRPPLIVSIILPLILVPIGWVVWSYITYFVGTRLFKGTATPGELMRTIGFAQAPQVLNILSFIPIIGGLISLVVFFWTLWAGIVAVRQALDFDTGKAVVTVLIGAIAYFVIIFVISAVVAAPFAMMATT